MKKILPVLFIALAGCNGGSIAHQQPGNTPVGSGGSTGGATTSTTPTDSGGTAGNPSGGAAGSLSGGAAGSATGGTSAVGTGGSTTPAGQGGATSTGSGGASGTGGGVTGTGGADTPDAGANGGNTGTLDARGNDGPAPGTGGELGTGGAAGTGGAQGTGGARGTGGAQGTGGSAAACIPAATPGPRGMKTGQACMGCHVAGGNMSSMPFTAAGTLYASATGGTVVSGATVTITDAANKKVTMVTASDGNFYTNSAIAFPATVQVSKCPDTALMIATIEKADCNSCHNSSMRIHLP